MPFENFYKNSPTNHVLSPLFLGLTVILLASFLVCVCIIGFLVFSADPEENTIDTRTSAAERLRRADAACSEIPKPEKYYFVHREPPFYGENMTAVTYYFKSERALAEIKPILTMWFVENDWQPDATNGYAFKKGSQMVSIAELPQTFDGNIQIYCATTESVYHIYD